MSKCPCPRCSTLPPKRPEDKLIVEGYGVHITWLAIPFLIMLGAIILGKT